MQEHLGIYFQALDLAAEKHKSQRRAGYDPLPYVNHLIKVSNALINIAKETDQDTILASILHDIIEDSDVTEAQLAEQFGAKVASIVAELTDDMELKYAARKQLQVDRAAMLSLPARKIRIADKACNIQDIFSYSLDWPVAKKLAYLENSIQVVEQIRGVNSALEQWFDEMVGFAKKASQNKQEER